MQHDTSLPRTAATRRTAPQRFLHTGAGRDTPPESITTLYAGWIQPHSTDEIGLFWQMHAPSSVVCPLRPKPSEQLPVRVYIDEIAQKK